MINKDQLISGKLYKTNALAWAGFYDKTQKDCFIIPNNGIFLYINNEPYEDAHKKCIHFNIIFKDKILYVEKATLERFLSQIDLH